MRRDKIKKELCFQDFHNTEIYLILSDNVNIHTLNVFKTSRFRRKRSPYKLPF